MASGFIRDFSTKKWKSLIKSYRYNNNSKAYEALYNHCLGIIHIAITLVKSKNKNINNYDEELLIKIGEHFLQEAIKKVDINKIYDFRIYFRMVIYNKLLNHIEQNPITYTKSDVTFLISNISNELGIYINPKDYLQIRCMIELLPIKVKICILMYYGNENNQKFTINEIAEQLNETTDLVEQAISIFNEKLLNQINIEKTPVKKRKSNNINRSETKTVDGIKLIDYFKDKTLEELVIASKVLPYYQQKILYARFGSNLNEINILETDNILAIKRTIIPNLNRIFNGEEIVNRKPNLFEKFSDKTEEEIINVVLSLEEVEQDLIHKMYNQNLSGFNSKALSQEERLELKKILKKIDSILNPKLKNKRKPKGKKLTDYFDNCTLEELVLASKKLPYYQRIMLEDYFGKDLSGTCFLRSYELYILTQSIIPNLERILNHEEPLNRKPNLFEKFSDKTEEEIINVVLSLEEVEQDLIHKMYNQNLSGFNSKALSQEERLELKKILKKIDSILNPKLKNKRKPKGKKLTDYFDNCTLEELILASKKLPYYQRIMLEAYFDKNLDGLCYLPAQKMLNLTRTIKPNLERILNGENAVNHCPNLFEKFSDKTEEEIINAVLSLDLKEQQLIYKMYDKDLKGNNSRLLSAQEKKELKKALKKLDNILNPKHKNTRKPKGRKLIEYFEGKTLEELVEASKKLPYSQQKILYARFGSNLNEINILETDNILAIKRTIIPNLNRIFNGEEVINRRPNLFERYAHKDENEVVSCVLSLDLEFQQLIYKMYDKDLKGNNSRLLSAQEKKELKKALKKLDNILNPKHKNTRKPKGRKLIEYFEGKTLEELVEASKKLPYYQQKILEGYFGKSLNETCFCPSIDMYVVSHTIIPNLNRIFNGEEVANYKPNLFERYFYKTEEEVINAVLSLDLKEQQLIYKMCDKDLKGYNDKLLSKEEKKELNKVLKKLYDILNPKSKNTRKPRGKKLTKYFDGVLTKEELSIIISELPPLKSYLFYKRFGSRLNEVNPMDKLEYQKLFYLIEKIREKYVINKETITEDNLEQNIIDNLTNKICAILNDNPGITKLEAIIFVFRMYLSVNSPYDMQKLVDYFKMSEDEINRTAQRVLFKLDSSLGLSFEDNIASLSSCIDEAKAFIIKPLKNDDKKVV